jgi:hypothetical protein
MFSFISTTTNSNQQVAITCDLMFKDDPSPGTFEVFFLAPVAAN